MCNLSFFYMIKKDVLSYLPEPAVNNLKDTQRDLLAHGCPDLSDPGFKMPTTHINVRGTKTKPR